MMHLTKHHMKVKGNIKQPPNKLKNRYSEIKRKLNKRDREGGKFGSKTVKKVLSEESL